MKRTVGYLLFLLLFLAGCAAPKADGPANVVAEYRGQQVFCGGAAVFFLALHQAA